MWIHLQNVMKIDFLLVGFYFQPFCIFFMKVWAVPVGQKCLVIQACPQGMTFRGNQKYPKCDFFVCEFLLKLSYTFLYFLKFINSDECGGSSAVENACSLQLLVHMSSFSQNTCIFLVISAVLWHAPFPHHSLWCVEMSCHITEEQSCESLGGLTSQATQNP